MKLDVHIPLHERILNRQSAESLAMLQILAEIKQRAADKKRALWIDNEPDVGRWNHDVAFFRPVHQIHFVLQSGTAAANNRHAQSAA